jgi:Sulfotransferase family
MAGNPGFLFVIGAQRCGTSSLRDVLDAHPDVEMARPFAPETKWFLHSTQPHDLDAFVRRHFDPARSPAWRGEKSTSYIERSEAVDRISSAVPAARIIAVVREPISRAVSNYAFSLRNGIEDRPIDVALSPDIRPRPWDSDRFSVSPFAYLNRGRYADHLVPWLERFGSAVKILLFEDLVAGRAAPELFTSLDLPCAEGVPMVPRVNASPEPLRWPAAGVIDALECYYAGPNAALARLIGRDLSEWSYSRRSAPTYG